MNNSVPTVAYVALGSNLGNSLATLNNAVMEIDALSGCTVCETSSWYQNPAIGPAGQPDFVNGVIKIETTRSPQSLLTSLQQIENQFGRERTTHWGPRTLDLDILLFGELQQQTTRLTIPHPRLHERNFVLYPLYELNPELRLPNGQALGSLLTLIPDTGLTKIITAPSN